METIELGGLVAEAFKIWLSNPDIAVGLITFTIFSGLVITAIQVYRDFSE